MFKRSVMAGVAVAAACALGGGVAQAADDAVVGPDGYKTLHLGQSLAEAEATGLLVGKQVGENCTYYSLRPEEGQSNPGSGVFVDPAEGVVFIGGTSLSRTPEHVTLGTARSDVEAAYEDLTPVPPQDWIVETDVPGGEPGSKYRFAFDQAEAVSDFGLRAANTGGCTS
ncbi:hypothetical protein GIY23_15730 [Allosaccharopolyspora coralli]|uniref:Secreted protein n=1 Tax=Allosaccharopolyspora coralli TaxID=2665642 RepID=A0A5Q3Q8R8_9PSEU|nr:hypothetical protein [Allosaccharopolyspora coralli]QGK70773.1 hypothetical protein GIY23_15730 [Allosaccharopolyspora coralli]